MLITEKTTVTLLLFITLVVIVECWVELPLHPHQQNAAERARFWLHKTFAPSDYDMVLVGDSRIYRGLSPEAMREVLPRWRILNFGYSSGGINREMLQLAEEKIDPAALPKLIVLGITPHSLTFAARANAAIRGYRAEATWKRVLIEYGFDALFDLFLPTSPALLRKEILKRNQDTTGQRYLQLYHFKSGWVASDKQPRNQEESLPSYRNNFLNNKVASDSENELLAQVNQWHQRGWRIIAFRPPSTPQMELLENELSGFDEDRFIKRFRSVGGLWWTLPHDESLTSYDGSHLEQHSASRLSRHLARWITQKEDMLQSDH